MLKMGKNRMFREADLPLEVVILLIAGMTMLITGILLFPVSAGSLPYFENGLYGLLLVMFSLQIITLGKTPFGDVRRSKPLIALGVVIAAVGIVTCFVPTFSARFPAYCCSLFWPGRFSASSADVLCQREAPGLDNIRGDFSASDCWVRCGLCAVDADRAAYLETESADNIHDGSGGSGLMGWRLSILPVFSGRSMARIRRRKNPLREMLSFPPIRLCFC